MTGANLSAVVATTVFDGTACHKDCAVVINGSSIAQLLSRRELPDAMPVTVLPVGAWLAPGFIDVQVNGGGDTLFNDSPNAQSIEFIANAHRRFGTTGLLPTLITDKPSKIGTAIQAVDRAAGENPSILGIHLEGPFISPDKPGVHDRTLIRLPNDADLELLIAPRKLATLVTLAPERMPSGFINRLTRAGVRVSLGHSMATYDETKAALRSGLTGFTHLFNAMPQLASRDPGPIAAALEASDAWYGMIVDGAHVAPPMLRLALRGLAHPMLVTDAMPPVGGTRASFQLYGETIAARDGRCTRGDGTLAGATLDMAAAVRNTVQMLGVSLEEALRFASLEPARFLGLDAFLGRLAPHFRADMVCFDPNNLRIHDTWVAGEALNNQSENGFELL